MVLEYESHHLAHLYGPVLQVNILYPIGSMVLLYMVTWIPSIYPSHVSIPAPWIRHGYMEHMGNNLLVTVIVDPTLNINGKSWRFFWT